VLVIRPAVFNGYILALDISKKSLLALSYLVLDAARHPSQGGCCALCDTQENANKGTVVTQSQGVSRAALVLWNMLMARTNWLSSYARRIAHQHRQAAARMKSALTENDPIQGLLGVHSRCGQNNLRLARGFIPHGALHRNGTVYSIYHAAKFDNGAIADQLTMRPLCAATAGSKTSS
jgi:hypothetical protein